jgi:hypothetical protein
MRALAKRIIAHEATARDSPRRPFAVIERLRPPLGTLMGTGGFRALVARALALACGEVAWLRALRMKSNGTLEGFEEIYPPIAPQQCLEGRVALLSQLLALLVALIGQGLTSQLIGDTWTHLSPHLSDTPKRDKNEEPE